jgi:glutamate--cysteine ligase
MITTDFSEAQLELITPVSNSITDSLDTLDRVHRFVYSALQDELLWSSSMPCAVPDDDNIPLARYGSSNLGQLKTTYRNGLGHRYGRAMQTICAIHYNFSFSDEFWETLANIEESDESLQAFRSRRYFDLMRNFRRYSWLLIYLFGASPAVCNSFLVNRNHNLEEFDYGSAYHPDGTSLRNGDLGYQSEAQSDLLNICYNSLDDYVNTLRKAICTPHPSFHALKSSNEERAQVNGNILQSEAEFYTTIRAKRVPRSGENFLSGLSERGVEYLEVRLLDINPYLPLGIDATEIRFLDTFLLFCLLNDSPAHGEDLCAAVQQNVLKTVHAGRKDDLLLDDNGQDRPLRQWGNEILADMAEFAASLDGTTTTGEYSKSLTEQIGKINSSEKTPSARILNDMREQSIPFFRFAMNQAISHRESFLATPLTTEETAKFNSMSAQSVKDHLALESKDEVSFDEYLANLQSEYEQPLS